MLDFIVYGAPQGKGRPRVGRFGGGVRMFTPQKTVAYEGLVAHCGATAMGDRQLFTGPVELRLLIDVQIPASWSKRKQAQALPDELPAHHPLMDARQSARQLVACLKAHNVGAEPKPTAEET